MDKETAMSDQNLWEYRVVTVGSFWQGPKEEELEARLNELGLDSWEVISIHAPANTNKLTIVAKRPLTAAARRRRTVPA